MKVNSNSQRDISFQSLYTNKALKKTFEFASNKPALFAASSSVAFSIIRPVSIWTTPNTNVENRKLACAKSIVSSILNFGIVFGISQPINNALKKIEKTPENYLQNNSIKFYKEGLNNISISKRFTFASQIFKLGILSGIAVPKAIMTAGLIPYIIKLFNNDKNSVKESATAERKPAQSSLVFKGKDIIPQNIGKVLDKKGMKEFTEKFKTSNFVMHIMAITDTLSTLTFIHQAKNSKKIKDERKKALIYNAGLSTGLCIGTGYAVDKLLDKPVESFIKNYSKANKHDKNLEKQIQGIKIVKPLLILGTIYYVLIPIISTYFAEFAEGKNKGVNKGINK